MSEWLSAVRLSTLVCVSLKGPIQSVGSRGAKGLSSSSLTTVVVVALESFS